MRGIALFVATALLFTTAVFAQPRALGAVRGFVYEKESGEPLIFTNVFLKGTTYGASTDVNGYYAITRVPPGEYTLVVTYLGYDSLLVPIELKEGQILTRKLVIQKAAIELEAVEVSAERQEAKTEVQTSLLKITPQQIKQMPTVGGEPDIAQYLQVLPGVVFTGDQGGQLYIRGGSPVQNKVLLDGMTIYNPFHSIGLFSVLDADIIRNADVYTGGFPSDYGGRISSVMDITTRDGNKRRMEGKVSANTFLTKALLEGPIVKYSSPDKGSSSFIVTAKHSYLRQSSKWIYPDMMRTATAGWLKNASTGIDSAGLPYNFTDLYGKVSLNSAQGSKLNLFGFHFRDQVNYQLVSDLHWQASGFGSNFLLIPNQTSVLVGGNFSYSNYLISLEESDGLPRMSQIKGFNTGLDFTYFFGHDEMKYGIEVMGIETDFDFFNRNSRHLEQNDFTTELAAHLRYKRIWRKFILQPNMRIQYYASLSTFSPEPRLGVKYNATDRIRLKFAAGFYSQNLISAVSDRDVVNLFYGFLSGPDNLQDSVYFANGAAIERKHALQKARHVILGTEYDLFKHATINVEGYYKQFTQLTNINRNKIFDDTPDYASRPDYQKKDFIIETGYAMGGDFLLKYNHKRWYLWLVYSLGFVYRYDNVLTDDEGRHTSYPPHFDRRHNVNVVVSYTFGKDLTWEADARWNYGSGFPFTQTQGFYEKLQFNDINVDYTSASGDLAYIYGPLNDGLLPVYHRLDATLKRKFLLTETAEMEANISITNLYNRQNIFYFDRVRFKRVDQLPILPSIGMNLSF